MTNVMVVPEIIKECTESSATSSSWAPSNFLHIVIKCLALCPWFCALALPYWLSNCVYTMIKCLASPLGSPALCQTSTVVIKLTCSDNVADLYTKTACAQVRIILSMASEDPVCVRPTDFQSTWAMRHYSLDKFRVLTLKKKKSWTTDP